MTTFTRIRGDETPLIEVDAAKRLSKIDPMTYGGFTEYVLKPPGAKDKHISYLYLESISLQKKLS
jgi:hypothetical protein